MASLKPFTVYKRPRKKGKAVYYIQFRMPDGTRSPGISSGCTSRSAAEAWAYEHVKEAGGQFKKKDSPTFLEYAKDFFLWESSWATDKRARGLRISPRHCRERSDLLNKHLLPQIGEKRLTDIDRGTIKEIRNNLFNKGYLSGTINHVLSTLKAVLEAAEEDSLIEYVPKIDRAAARPKQKGILTIDEVKRLFMDAEWYDYRGYLGNLLACISGLRLGEILGLVIEDVHFDEGYIHVRRSWDTRLKVLNATTKTGRARNIFLPGKVFEEIRELLNVHPFREPGAFLFFGHSKEVPADGGIFKRSLINALQQIGISEDERKQRNITFHSHRHWLNSLLINSKIPLQKIQSITGHVTAEMSQHYYRLDDMTDVIKIQEGIFH